jgi:hypothetical protein
MSRQWTEKVTTYMGESEIVYEEWVCPDSECQKLVDEKIKAAQEKKELLDSERKERIKNYRNNRHNIHFSKKTK